MSERKILKLIHLAGTVWFAVCVVYVLVVALRGAGFHWWLIFSISGHSAVILFMLTSLYVFAVFRGVGGAQQIPVEHPLTTTNHYMGVYVAAPLLGGAAGLIGMIGSQSVAQYTAGIAMATLGTTFFCWVLADPVIGLVETMLPASREHRARRLREAERERHEKNRQREKVLALAIEREQTAREQWRQVMRPQVEQLVALLDAEAGDIHRAEQEAVDIGAKAWEIGGLTCMEELRDMAIAISRRKWPEKAVIDYLAVWWDGIGEWRRPSTDPQ